MAKRNITRASKNALRDFKKSEEELNHNKLVKAYNSLIHNAPGIVKKGTKLTVTSVAKEAGLSRGTVYLHKDILEKISAFKANPTGSDFQRNKAIRAAEIAKEEFRKDIIEQLQADKHKLAQENLKLSMELQDAHEKIAELRKKNIAGKVVAIHSVNTR